jgi:hypothetical protein
MRILNVIMLITCLTFPFGRLLFSPPAPSPWFIERVELEPFDLPSGVSIALVKNESSKVPKEYIVIKNNSSIPLHVAGTPDFCCVKFDETSTGFPPGIGLIYKVVDGQAYKWDSEWGYDGSELSYIYDWFPDADYERNDSIWLYVYGNQIRSRIGKIVDLAPLNQFDGNRPEDVKIPEPQKALLPIIYGDDKMDIPLTVSYTLNDDYRPYRTPLFSESFYSEMISCFVVACLMAFILLALWFAISIARRLSTPLGHTS